MLRIQVLIIAVTAMIFIAGSAVAQQQDLTALDIFEGMIYYENDQLEKNPGTTDFHCIKTETTQRAGTASSEIMVKDIYFMVPGYYLELIGEDPAFYRDVSDVGTHLLVVDLNKLRNEEINGIPCYVIQMIPKDQAYRQYTKTYYVAMDDFRKVRTVSINANDELDNLTTEINYTYTEVDGFMLLSGESATWSDAEGNAVATVTTVYSDYEFNVGLDDQFFADYRENRTIIAPLT